MLKQYCLMERGNKWIGLARLNKRKFASNRGGGYVCQSAAGYDWKSIEWMIIDDGRLGAHDLRCSTLSRYSVGHDFACHSAMPSAFVPPFLTANISINQSCGHTEGTQQESLVRHPVRKRDGPNSVVSRVKRNLA